MPVSNSGGGEIARKTLVVLEHILGQDIEEDDKIEEDIDRPKGGE